jgi:hypothetical protein
VRRLSCGVTTGSLTEMRLPWMEIPSIRAPLRRANAMRA